MFARQSEIAQVLSPDRTDGSNGLPSFLAGAAMATMDRQELEVDI
jgi:hypothetical protein